MEAFLVLADAVSADPAAGKINMLGAGWSIIGPQSQASGISCFIRMPWDEAQDQVQFTLRLEHSSGSPFLPFRDRDDQLKIGGSFAVPDLAEIDEVGKSVPFNVAFALPIPPLPLQTGHIYRWVMEVNGEDAASVEFAVRPESPADE
ncbi:DUF6941 family protein [Nonomuraea soli]|uniref:Uncharacterized protein n=1 Tax=Nonomuraea soli TaxID=1032476 RepID=A0A7W0HVY6_9ACTN|nr:hypothetical protein [Nonomuraea soli]MBA2897683.1 hypothetical protein [Nonomuraea soli]